MKLLITGATGYIGRRLVASAVVRGHQVVVAGRKRPAGMDVEWTHFDLANPQTVELPNGLDAVVHLAVMTSPSAETEKSEVAAAESLLSATARAKVPILFVSSQTARADAPTAYGRNKWQIEQSVLAQGGWVVRPGQVYGGSEAGLFGVLVNVVRRLPMLPAFVPAPRVQPVHVDDLVGALLSCLERRPKSGIFQIAEPDPVSFTTFLSAIARGRVRRRRVFVPVPVSLVRTVLKALGPERSRRIGLDRLLSLFALPPMQTANDLDQLGVVPRPLFGGMACAGSTRRRWLIQEGRAILTYVLREEPGCELIRRYVRGVESLRPVGALDLPSWSLRFPSLIALVEGGALLQVDLRPELAWRLNAAVALAEATPQGARRFLWLGDRSQGGLIKAVYVCRALAGEVLARIGRLLVIPLVVSLKGKRGERE
ncbi:sugar nucleotide-binding protein [Achromobacter spanius]|uniref:NAD-dependent epimerase/dehydratase family protein n=1 Tax=Achromobacter spanius TaxID=217203 RepID=UPI0032094F26